MRSDINIIILCFLDWSELDDNVAELIVKWIYTDVIDLSQSDDKLIDLMKTANSYNLEGLVQRCEKTLIARAGVKNCVR